MPQQLSAKGKEEEEEERQIICCLYRPQNGFWFDPEGWIMAETCQFKYWLTSIISIKTTALQ